MAATAANTNECGQATTAPAVAAATAANVNEGGWEGQMRMRAGECEQRRTERMQASNGGTSSAANANEGRREGQMQTRVTEGVNGWGEHERGGRRAMAGARTAAQ